MVQECRNNIQRAFIGEGPFTLAPDWKSLEVPAAEWMSKTPEERRRHMAKIDPCAKRSESLEHLLVTCHFTATLWKELLVWCNGRDINIETLSAVDILFGDWQRKDCFLLFNHIILIAKQYVYYCRTNNLKPLFNVLLLRIKSVYQLECKIAKWKNKWQFHFSKWSKCGFEDK